jgi:hypothetical protein
VSEATSVRIGDDGGEERSHGRDLMHLDSELAGRKLASETRFAMAMRQDGAATPDECAGLAG